MKDKYELKTFGLTKDEVLARLNKLTIQNLDITVEEAFLDATITLNVREESDFYSELVDIANSFKVNLYSTEGMTLAEVLVNYLIKEGQMISVAESITGGLISSKFISVSGASRVLYEGIVCYNAASKVRRIYVPSDTIEKFGAVSEEVCRAMTFGLLSGNREVDYVVTSTGYAEGDAKGENNGLVYIGFSKRLDKKIAINKYNLSGNRNAIRELASNYALFSLIEFLNINNIEID